MIKASAVFDCGDVGRLRGPAAQERELEHVIEPYAQHLDASSRTRATRPSLQNLVSAALAVERAARGRDDDAANRAHGARKWGWAAWEQPQRRRVSHDLGLLQPCRERRDDGGGDQRHPGQTEARRRAASDGSDCGDCASQEQNGISTLGTRIIAVCQVGHCHLSPGWASRNQGRRAVSGRYGRCAERNVHVGTDY